MTRVVADVAVVGGGPAGAVVALLLARDGFDVVVLERQAVPRPKPCGDCLSAQAASLLADLGLLAAVRALDPARLDGWRVFAPSGDAFESRFADLAAAGATAPEALALPRERLDAALLAAAGAAGARIRTRTRVTGVGARGEVLARTAGGGALRVDCRLAVAADGLRSTLARGLGAPARRPALRKVSLTAHARGVDGIDRIGEMHVAAGACLGVAPVHADARLHNVTLVVDTVRDGRAMAADPVAFFHAALARFPGLRGRLDRIALEPHGARGPLLASGPFDFPVRTAVGDGIALVGDAAGYYDPFTGQGIFHAMAAARLLAREAAAALRSGDVSAARLRRYDRGRRRLHRGMRLVQRGVEAVLSRPGLADRAIRRLDRRPRVAGALIAVTGDLRPARSLASPALLLSFLAPSTPESPS